MIHSITFATQITLARILLTPFVVQAIITERWVLALFIALIAALTDFLDGYYARYYNQETQFGKIMDPIADKIFIFATLWSLHTALGNQIVPIWFMLFLLCKEAILIGGGLFLMHRHYPIISPSVYAKSITALLMVFMMYIIAVCCHVIPIYFFYTDTTRIFFLFACSMIFVLLDYGYKMYTLLQRKLS